MRPTSKTKDLYDVANFNDQTAMLNLADPTVSSIDVSRINNNGSFAYVLQRGGVTRMLNGTVHDWAEGSYQGLTKTLIGFAELGNHMLWPRGFVGCASATGLSFILTTWRI